MIKMGKGVEKAPPIRIQGESLTEATPSVHDRVVKGLDKRGQRKMKQLD
jgi:hypothetical protein